MRLLPRVIAVLVMLVALFLLISRLRGLQAAGEVETSRLVSYYFWILGLSAATALVTCICLLPLLGEFAGGFLFNPNEEIERDPHASALAKLAAGDFQGAIDDYREVYEDDPQDTHAATEIVRLYCEKLNEPDPAAEFLIGALSYPDRTKEEIAFFSQRLVDVCWIHQHDAIRARAILIKIAEDMPETREAANALHRLQEIERSLGQEVPLPMKSAITEAAKLPLVATVQQKTVDTEPPEKAAGL